MKTYTESDQERAERAARRGFFGQCAALVAAAVMPERVYSFGVPENHQVVTVFSGWISIPRLTVDDYIFMPGDNGGSVMVSAIDRANGFITVSA